MKCVSAWIGRKNAEYWQAVIWRLSDAGIKKVLIAEFAQTILNRCRSGLVHSNMNNASAHSRVVLFPNGAVMIETRFYFYSAAKSIRWLIDPPHVPKADILAFRHQMGE